MRWHSVVFFYGDAAHGGREDDEASEERVRNSVAVVIVATAADMGHNFVVGGRGGRDRGRHGGAEEDGGDAHGGAGVPAWRRECAAGGA